jgi:two-component system response regulator RegA
MTTPSGPLILLVEDDAVLRGRLARAFADRGLDVRQVTTFDDARQAAEAEPPELVLLDLRIPGGQSLDLIPFFKELDAETRIVVLTGYGSIATAVEAVRRGATQYLTKPADANEILAAFERGGGDTAHSLDLQPMSLDRVEWEHINRVVVACQGNVSEAARVLGIHRRSLQRKLARYPSRR